MTDEMPKSAPPTDELLQPFLRAPAEDAPRLLGQLLVEQAGPVIKQIVKSKLCLCLASARRQEAEDIYSEVQLQLLARLQAIKADPAKPTITNFRSYVAVTTYHVCYEYLRRKYPQYQQLKNQLRYLLSKQRGWALWSGGEGVWLAGFAHWSAARRAQTDSARLQELSADPEQLAPTVLGNRAAQWLDLSGLLAALFDWVGHAIELDQLVNLMARLRGITQMAERPIDEDGEANDQLTKVPDPHADVATEVEARLYLAQLWGALTHLPIGQRTALLLNLRDEKGGNVIALLPHTRIASLRDIAAALELPAQELAELWPQLPLNDDAIAARLKLTRQQVINLRLAARRCLARQLKAWADSHV